MKEQTNPHSKTLLIGLLVVIIAVIAINIAVNFGT